MTLKHYHAFELTPGGEVITRIDLHCGSVDDAKQWAKELSQDTPIELWEGPIRIARFEPPHHCLGHVGFH